MHRPLEAPLAREILRAMPEEHARPSNVYVDDELYVTEENAEALRYAAVAGVADARRRRPRDAGSSGRRRRSSPSATPRELDALRDELQPRFGNRAFVAKSLPHFLEFAAPGVSKASGLALVADLLGFTAGRPSAFGDGENDLEMLDVGRLRAWPSRTPTERLIGEADWRHPARCTTTACAQCSRRSPPRVASG